MTEASTDWRINHGPHSRGHCAVRDSSPTTIDIIAPPGVPLEPPEPVPQLRQWRTGRYNRPRGQVSQESIAVVSLQRALDMAPNVASWMAEVDAENKRRDEIAQARRYKK